MTYRRSVALLFAFALLAPGACSSGGDDAAKAVCKTRANTQLAVSADVAVSVDQYPTVVKGLAAAIKVAPKDIKADFVKVHSVLKPFVDALVKAHGDQNVAAQDPSFQQLVADVGTAEANAAAARIRAYYNDHCGKQS